MRFWLWYCGVTFGAGVMYGASILDGNVTATTWHVLLSVGNIVLGIAVGLFQARLIGPRP